MKFALGFVLSSYALVLLGLLGLLYTGEVSAAYLLFASLSLAVAIVFDLSGTKGLLPVAGANLAMVAIFVFTVVSIFFLTAPPVQELVHFLLALQAVKLLTAKKNRDWLQLYLLSFFSVVAASALTVELSFAAVFVAYLFLAPWTLILLQLKEASESAGKDARRETPPFNAALVGLAGGAGVALCVLTAFFFVVFPRLGVRLFADRWASGAATTGFSDLLALGGVAEIQRSSAVAMRVKVDRKALHASVPYWRGMALDYFDGQIWRKSKTRTMMVPRRGEWYVIEAEPGERASATRQTVMLEPNGSTALFSLGRPLAFSGRLGSVYRDFLGNFAVGYPFPFQIAYDVFSAPRASWLDETPSADFLQLPALDRRIAELARAIASGSGGAERKARALERFLKERYRYALEDLPVGEGALSAFLFEARRGNCEYFSSALAVMLRTLGIPARIVNGYLGGEWNPYGEYYLIRQSDAHSWVEAHVGDKGWVTLDPTPSLPPGARRSASATSLFFDSLQVRWYRYVVNFGFADQRQLLTILRQPDHWLEAAARLLRFEGWPPGPRERRSDWARPMAGLLALAALVLIAKRRRGYGVLSRARAAHAATERYRSFLSLVEKKFGFKKRPGETADEFGRKLLAAGIAGAEELARCYQQARFSGGPASAELNRMEEILRNLKRLRPATRRRRPWAAIC